MRLGWAIVLCSLLAGPARADSNGTCGSWEGWEQFKASLIDRDGRVVDATTPRRHTVSEGQAYGLFFALVADDRASFDHLLQWTEQQMARDDLTATLPAWQWGRLDDGNWGPVDANSASDADLWIAYTLVEAGRLWKVRRYVALGRIMAHRVVAQESERLPGLGLTLLPAPVGFKENPTHWRLNPSYVPLQLLTRLAQVEPANPAWPELLASSRRLLSESAPHGFAPDWAVYQADGGFSGDTQTQAEGAYNAIRVYLWLGMLAPGDPALEPLGRLYRPMAEATVRAGAPPERIDTAAGVPGSQAGPAGFSAALLPYLSMLGLKQAAEQQRERQQALAAKETLPYYEQALSLFGLGWYQGRFRFAQDGALETAWGRPCFAAPY
jgi:endoglucanase